MPIDEKTSRLGLELPSQPNPLKDDVERLRDTFKLLDEKVATINDDGRLEDDQAPANVPKLNDDLKIDPDYFPDSVVQLGDDNKISIDIMPDETVIQLFDAPSETLMIDPEYYKDASPGDLMNITTAPYKQYILARPDPSDRSSWRELPLSADAGNKEEVEAVINRTGTPSTTEVLTGGEVRSAYQLNAADEHGASLLAINPSYNAMLPTMNVTNAVLRAWCKSSSRQADYIFNSEGNAYFPGLITVTQYNAYMEPRGAADQLFSSPILTLTKPYGGVQYPVTLSHLYNYGVTDAADYGGLRISARAQALPAEVTWDFLGTGQLNVTRKLGTKGQPSSDIFKDAVIYLKCTDISSGYDSFIPLVMCESMKSSYADQTLLPATRGIISYGIHHGPTTAENTSQKPQPIIQAFNDPDTGPSSWIHWRFMTEDIANGDVAGSIDVKDKGTITPASSDRRVKRNIKPITGTQSLENIKRMEFMEFIYKNDPTNHVCRGPIAQQLQEIDSRYVTRYTGTVDGVQHDDLLSPHIYPLLSDALAAIKELSGQVKALQAENEALREDVMALKNSEDT